MPDNLPAPEESGMPALDALASASEAMPVSDPVLVIDAATAEAMATPPPVLDSGMAAGGADAAADAVVDTETGESIRDSGIGSSSVPENDELVAPPPEAPPVVPPSEAMTDAPKIFSDFTVPEGPGAAAVTQAEKVTASDEMVALLISDENTQLLWKRIDDSIGQIHKRVQSQSMARQLFDQIQAARNELLGGKANYEEAERFINEVEYRISQGERVRTWSYTFGGILFLYEFAFAIAMVYVLFIHLVSGLQPNGHFIVYMGVSMVFGGLGGVMGAWFSLVKHVAQDQDFEWQHTMWYLTSPLLGVFSGLVVVVIAYVGLISLLPNTDTTGINIATPWSVYLLAFLTGYQHNVFIDLLKRALKIFEGQSKK
jgi:hypothetical protein